MLKKYKDEFITLRDINLRCYNFNCFDLVSSKSYKIEKLIKLFLKCDVKNLPRVKFSFVKNLVRVKAMLDEMVAYIELTANSRKLFKDEKRILCFNKVFVKFYRKLKIKRERYLEFIHELEVHDNIDNYSFLNLVDLHKKGYNSFEVIIMYEKLMREYCYYDGDYNRDDDDSDSDSDSDIY